jgi:threonine synthase
MKEIILKIIREYSINAKNYDVTILREDLDNMSDDMVREITRHLEKEVSTQDPAIDISTNPNTPNVWKELYDRYKLNSLVDDLNVIDTRDEIEIKEEIKKGDIDFMYKWIREKSGK